ncbi:response regulator transcription factor [Nocardioides aestuarii]|uniref:Response regulator n=1 Tax=Nocardioides aestuarii TaxID=252231 RepID=A0ABW4TS44_9ACTN
MNDVIRVVLADDHALVRAGLEQLLAGSGDISVVGTAADGEQAVDLACSLQPDVVLMDLQMPGVDGVSATREIRSRAAGVDVLVLTSYSDGGRILAALDAGAVGYLLKDAEPDEVMEGIRAVRRGESPLHPKAARQLLGARTGETGVELTPREHAVLELLRDGFSHHEVARRLGLSERTVKAHLISACARIGVADSDAAVEWLRRQGT